MNAPPGRHPRKNALQKTPRFGLPRNNTLRKVAPQKNTSGRTVTRGGYDDDGDHDGDGDDDGDEDDDDDGGGDDDHDDDGGGDDDDDGSNDDDHTTT